jgi:hypothetical protein
MGGDDLHGYQCHDCQHIFYISVDELQREAEDMRAGKVVKLPKKETQKRRRR